MNQVLSAKGQDEARIHSNGLYRLALLSNKDGLPGMHFRTTVASGQLVSLV